MKTAHVAVLLWMVGVAVAGNIQATPALDDTWYNGKLFLKNGKTLKGELQLNVAFNTVLLKQNNKIRAYTPYMVDHFQLTASESVRTYYTLPYHQEGKRERLLFFELVFQDHFALLNREISMSREVAILSDLLFAFGNSEQQTVSVCEYYVILPDSKIVKFDTNPVRIASQLASDKNEKKAINDYIYGRGLDLNRRADLIKVLDRFIPGEESNSI